MIISHAYKYVFLRTRKTASTSIAEYLVRNLFEEGDVYVKGDLTEFVNIYPKMSNDIGYHHDMKILVESNLVNLDEYKVFAVLRDPYERIVSRAFHTGSCQNVFEARNILAKGYVDEDDRDWPQSAYFKYNGEMLAAVWHYDQIAETLPAFVRSYRKEPMYPMRRLKSDLRPSWATTDTILTSKIKQKISEVFAEDVELYEKYAQEPKIVVDIA